MSRLGFRVCAFWILPITLLLPRLTALSGLPRNSPLQTIELLHKAFRDADAVAVDSLLHEAYHGISLGGSPDHRQIYVETRAKAVSDVAALKPGSWDVRILSASTKIDPNGMAHVWARYVFYFNGKPNHCGYESYSLYESGRTWKVVSFADTDNPLNGKSAAEVCPTH
jgi:hypothetical protein